MRFMQSISVFFMGCALLASCEKRKVYYECCPAPVQVVQQSYVHKYGIEVPREEWSERGKTGKVVSTLKTGVVVTKNYEEGYLEGETTYTFPHSGAIQKVEEYSSGQLIAEKEMYPTGTPCQEVRYERPNKKVVTVWYEDGSAQYREEYRDNKLVEADYYTTNEQVESKIDGGSGVKVVRDEFGQLISKDKFQNGELVQCTTFYPNGAPREIIPYYKNRIHGQRKKFLPGGEPSTIEEWNDDRQEGVTTLFQNGEKIAEVPYLNGIKNGVEERFKDGRFVVEQVNWKNGKRHGACYSYIGEDTHISWFYDGQEVSKRQYDRLLNPSTP